MAGHALNSDDIGSRLSDLAAKRVVDVADHFHHDASRFLRLFVIWRCIDWNLTVRIRRGTGHFDMAMAALYAERHVESLHHLHNLLTCPVFRQNLKIDRRSTTTAPAATATAFAAAAFALTLRCDHRWEHEQNAENQNSKSRYLAIRHRHLGRFIPERARNAKKFASFYKHPKNIGVKWKLMKQPLAIICGFLFIAVPAFSQSKTDQQTKTDPQAKTDKAQLVSTGEITKIDAKKKVIQVRNVADSNSSTNSGTGRRGGGGGGGGGGYPGGGGGRRGGRYPGGGGGGYPGGGGTATTNQVKEYKVFITKDTVLKLEDMEMEFNDLHVGDHVIVSGTPKGSNGDLEASAVTRKF